MKGNQTKKYPRSYFGDVNSASLRKTLREWQQVRTWARLILEAESLWHDESKAMRRLAALELSQLLDEVPTAQRRRVDRWLEVYSASTRFQSQDLSK